jgi:galactokinase/mevalonate kinase-like predicted kinase
MLNNSVFLLINDTIVLKTKVFFCNFASKITVNSIKHMADYPSYNGIGSSSKTVLRTTRKEPETRVSTQNPPSSTPSPRGHA